MRKILTITGALALMLAMVSTSAIADHRNPLLTFDPSSTVNVGTDVTLTGTAFQDGSQRTVELSVCLLDDVHVASAVCADDENAVWVEVASSTGATPTLTYLDANTSVAGVFGYRLTSAHDHDIADLTVEADTAAERHNGCKGIDNALTKANDKGKRALDNVAAKLGC